MPSPEPAAIARYTAQQGAKVVLGARRTDRLADITTTIRAAGGQAAFTELDVTRPDSMTDFVRFVVDTFGTVDVFVSNAGVMPLSYLNEYRISEWHQMVDVNIKGVLHSIAAALPVFDANQRGQFINITSVGDRCVGPTSSVYSATKFAVRALTEGLRQEVGTHVRVTLVAPGATESELAEYIFDPGLKKMVIEQFRATTLPAEAIAKAVAYAIAQPAEVDVNELVVRPVTQKTY